MTKKDFEAQIILLMNTLYRVSSSLLPRRQDQYDAVQNCLLRAWQRRESLRNPESFRPWLMRILINECHRIHRADRRISLADAPEQSQEMPDTTLRDAIRALPEHIRIPVMLHYLEGLSIQEVAQATAAPQGTVKTRLRRGRKLLRDQIEEEV